MFKRNRCLIILNILLLRKMYKDNSIYGMLYRSEINKKTTLDQSRLQYQTVINCSNTSTQMMDQISTTVPRVQTLPSLMRLINDSLAKHASYKRASLVFPALTDESKEIILKHLEKFKSRYLSCGFVCIPYSHKFGGYHYSPAFEHILKELNIAVPAERDVIAARAHPTIAFFCHAIGPSEIYLSYLSVRLQYFDAEFIRGIAYKEYDGEESVSISKSQYLLYKVVTAPPEFTNEQLGALVRSALATEPREYADQCSTILTPAELEECNQILLPITLVGSAAS